MWKNGNLHMVSLIYFFKWKISYREWKFETQLNRRIWGHHREISWKFDFLPIYASHNYNFYISVKLWSWRYFPIPYLLSKNVFRLRYEPLKWQFSNQKIEGFQTWIFTVQWELLRSIWVIPKSAKNLYNFKSKFRMN